ncbi:ankyrin [Hypoxylon sp. FL0890]|nr:ankyrin [Hypoxylon sp. FL0890]
MSASEQYRPVNDVWEVHRKTIYRQYIVERKPLKDVAAYMTEHYQFHKKPRDYEYRLKKWGYNKNISQAKRKLIQNEIKKRTEQGKASEILRAGLRLSLEQLRSRTQLPTLASKYLLSTPHSDGEMDEMSLSPQIPYLRVQTPPLVAQKGAWPGDLPWLSFNRKFEALLTAQFRQAINLTLPIYDFRSTQNRLMKFGSNNHDIALHKESSIQRLRLYLDLLCPEIHAGDHVTSADILLTGSGESASIEFLKLVVYFLSNHMDDELKDLTDGEVGDPVDVLRKFGLLTKGNIDWLKNASDETSEALLERLLRYSLRRDDGNLLRWILGERIDVGHLVHIEVKIVTFSSEGRACGYYSPMAQTLLQAATYYGSTSCCEILLNAGADPNLRADENGSLPLEYATYGYSHDKATRLFDLLLSAGARLDRGAHMLSLAAFSQNSSLVSRLMKMGVEISPATFGVAAESPEVLSLLFDNPDKWTNRTSSCPNVSDMVPPSIMREAIDLRIASREEDATLLKVIDVLLQAGADPDGIHAGETHIEHICTSNSQWAVDALAVIIKYGGHADQPKGRCRGRPSALQIAAGVGSIPIIQMLLDAGADVNYCYDQYYQFFSPKSFKRTTALLEALRASHAEAAKLLLKYEPQILGSELQEAAKIGDLTLMDMLFEAGARLQGDEMSFALEYRRPEIIEWLLQKGAVVPQASLLMIALCTRNFERILTALPQAVYDSESLLEATSLAVKTEQYAFVVEELVSKRATTVRDDLEVTALAVAVMNRKSLLRRLLSDSKFRQGSWTAPHRFDYYIALDDGIFVVRRRRSRSTEPVKFLFETDSGHVLELAAIFDSLISVDYAFTTLIDLGAFPSDTQQLVSIIRNQGLREPTLKQIIQATAKADPRLLQATEERSPLIAAIKYRPGLVKTLLEAGADANARPGLVSLVEPDFVIPRTPLQAAVERCRIDAIMQLLEAGANINAPPSCTRGATCLQIAAITGHIGIARMLLDRGANVNAPRARFYGRTAIEGAAENGRLDVVKLLLLQTAEAQGHRIQFTRAVKLATLRGHHAIAKLLRNHIQWNEDDQASYNLIDIRKKDILDEMTQELSPYELQELGIRGTTDKIPHDYFEVCSDLDEASEMSDWSSDDTDDGADDSTNNDPNETELDGQQLADQEVPMATPTAAGSEHHLGLVPVEGIQDLYEETPEQRLWAEQLRGIEEFNPQSPRYFPTLDSGDFSTGGFEFLSYDVFMGADIDRVTDLEDEGFM